MPRRVPAALLPVIATLAAAASAAADPQEYIVFATGDPAVAACAPYSGVPNAFTCDSLRAAVAAANANPGVDSVLLPTSGAYQLSQAQQLNLTSDVLIYGQSAPATAIVGNGSNRVLAVSPNVNADLFGLTIAGGKIAQGVGGNILNQGNLALLHVRVTQGSAPTGGSGIANVGPATLDVINSLIDNNSAQTGQGGGILNDGTSGAASLSISDSTIAFNQANAVGGISSTGGSSNSVAWRRSRSRGTRRSEARTRAASSPAAARPATGRCSPPTSGTSRRRTARARSRTPADSASRMGSAAGSAQRLTHCSPRP